MLVSWARAMSGPRDLSSTERHRYQRLIEYIDYETFSPSDPPDLRGERVDRMGRGTGFRVAELRATTPGAAVQAEPL